jgi:Zn-dependent protease with chaperone function
MNHEVITRLCLTTLLFATQAYAQSAAPTFPDPGKTSMSKENQRALGMQAAAQVYQQMPVLPDSSPETIYIRQIGQKLVATIPQENSWPFEFHVVPQKEINAFALPGGQMFVNVGTITAARNEAELAGVMGHEMAHVYMQHSAKQAGKAETTNTLAGLASLVLGSTVGQKAGGLVGQLGQMGIQMGAEGMMMKYSRTDESQADAVGAVVLYKAGYNPQGMADFFQMMASQGGQAPPQFFSDHPNSKNRQEAIQKEIANWPKADYASDSPDFSSVHEHAMQVKAYTAQEIDQGAKSGQWASMNQRNGASLNASAAGSRATGPGPRPTSASSFPTRAELEAARAPASAALQSVLPSQQMVVADLGPMKIRRPDNWPVTLPEQQGQFVTIAPKAGITSAGVGYGVLLNGTPAPAQRMSIDEMNDQMIKVLQQNNQLQQLDKPAAVMIGGIEGRSTLFDSASPIPDASGQPQKERDWLVTVPVKDGSMIFMIFVATEADFGRFQPTFDAMAKSVQLK